MANLCINMFYATIKVEETTERHEEIYQEINDFLGEKLTFYYSEFDECYIEIEFESKWTFPEQEVEEVTKQLQAKYPCEFQDLYMRCLSYEFGCEYVSYRIFQNGKWEVKL